LAQSFDDEDEGFAEVFAAFELLQSLFESGEVEFMVLEVEGSRIGESSSVEASQSH
jgi:hypothetical protein